MSVKWLAKAMHAITQTVNHWLLTMKAQVQSLGISCGICGGQISIGAGFSPSTSFSPVSYNSTSALYSTIIRGWYSRSIWDHSTRVAKWSTFSKFSCTDSQSVITSPELCNRPDQPAHYDKLRPQFWLNTRWPLVRKVLFSAVFGEMV
jgi:hypothetical protein